MNRACSTSLLCYRREEAADSVSQGIKTDRRDPYRRDKTGESYIRLPVKKIRHQIYFFFNLDHLLTQPSNEI